MSDFASKVQAPCAAEASAAHGNADQFGVMIETLARALGFTVAIASRGDGQAIDTMIEGATAYAHGEAVEKAPFAVLMANVKRGPRP